MKYTLYTYSGLSELRKIQDDHEIFPFIFVETQNLLAEKVDSYIDITALIYYLKVNKHDLYAAYNNFKSMTDETVVLVIDTLADEAISLFPYLFAEYKPIIYRALSKCGETDQQTTCLTYTRNTIYTYHNTNDLNILLSYANSYNIPIVTFSQASNAHEEIEKLNSAKKLALLDLTSLSYAIENNKNLIYLTEVFLNQFPNMKIISLTTQADIVLEYFPLYIEGQESIQKLLPNIQGLTQEETPVEDVKKVTNLTPEDFSAFTDFFNYNLIGHNYFKERFSYSLKNFCLLNQIKEQKVFSIFLFGESGIGKTEVARLIVQGLCTKEDNNYLAKINFQNYSSQDALNSLIGSPAGYIGCEHGELSEKIKKSKIAVLLCDEFEKTTRPVFSFFLELLEEGKFTDSMAREYDLDGYIIVFTSNIKNEAEYKKTIPQELQTRFDLVCEFQAPSYAEKTQFLNLLLERAKHKFREKFEKITLTDEDVQNLFAFDYSSINALRDLKRIFNNRLMDYFASKDV